MRMVKAMRISAFDQNKTWDTESVLGLLPQI